MKTVGIICEYNPFHNGHEYLLKKAKNDGCAVVAVMSGNYTQRGELAVTDKYTRAETAVKCGADLVLELPFPYAMSSAEFFARGGVSVLERIGADSICFGAECGDVEKLKKAAVAAMSADFEDKRANARMNEGFAKGYFDALGKITGEEVSLLSNDILGVEYIKEIYRRGIDIEPIAVKRVGDGFLDSELGVSEFASATAIRKAIRTGSVEPLERFMPQFSLRGLEEAEKRGELPADIKNIESAILAFWRMTDPASLSDIAELGNGLEYRIREAALDSWCLEKLEERVATKRYTAAKIRRAILFALFGVTKADLDADPQYTTVLAANSVGREMLSKARRKEGKIKIVTKHADARDCRQYELSSRADALYTLSLPIPKEAGYFAKRKIYIQ